MTGVERQWVAYRVVPGAMLTAPLPSAPEVGGGWRGVDLRRILPVDQLDPLVIDTGMKSEAALGIHVTDGYAYVIATARDAEPVRLILGAVPGADGVEAISARAGATGSGGRWRKSVARAFEAWSVHAPRRAESTAVLSLMGSEHPPAEAVAWLCAVLGILQPNDPIPDPLDLQSVARAQLEDEPATRRERKRWFSRGD